MTTEQTAQAQVLVGSRDITSQREGGRGPAITSPSLPLRPRCQARSALWLTGIRTRDQCLQRSGLGAGTCSHVALPRAS